MAGGGVVQCLQKISDFFRPTQQIAPADALKQYVDYLIRAAQGINQNLLPQPIRWQKGQVLLALQATKIGLGLFPPTTAKEISDCRKEIDARVGELQVLEELADEDALPVQTPTVNNQGGYIYLYRKMHKLEAERFMANKGNKPTEKTMAHNTGSNYKKYFTTSLSHTKEFANANSTDSDNEVVLEFKIKWNDYWQYAQNFGAPNQKTGVFDDDKAAAMNQERIVKGATANFRFPEQVSNVIANKEHHNLAVAHGNVVEFDKIVESIREVAPSEIK
jgi:hypothetical protein